MIRVLSYIGAFMVGGTITLILHCCLIMAKETDESLENKKSK